MFFFGEGGIIQLKNDHGYVPLVINIPGPFLIHDLSPGLSN